MTPRLLQKDGGAFFLRGHTDPHRRAVWEKCYAQERATRLCSFAWGTIPTCKWVSKPHLEGGPAAFFFERRPTGYDVAQECC